MCEEYGVKIKASKLKPGCSQMPFLGVIITKDGIIPNPEKVKAIEAMCEPKTLKQLRRVLGIFAYYRRVINNSAREQNHYTNKQRNTQTTNDKPKREQSNLQQNRKRRSWT